MPSLPIDKDGISTAQGYKSSEALTQDMRWKIIQICKEILFSENSLAHNITNGH